MSPRELWQRFWKQTELQLPPPPPLPEISKGEVLFFASMTPYGEISPDNPLSLFQASLEQNLDQRMAGKPYTKGLRDVYAYVELLNSKSNANAENYIRIKRLATRKLRGKSKRQVKSPDPIRLIKAMKLFGIWENPQ